MRRGAATFVMVLIVLAGCPEAPLAPRPPAPQPPDQFPPVPGTAQYPFASVRTTQVGSGNEEVFVYEPSDPAPESAPVIVFLHGHTAINPVAYGAWLLHLVRRGNIVVFPVYQTSRDFPHTYTPSALAAVQSAYTELMTGDHVRPDTERLAVVGHSLGCVIGMNFAVLAQAHELPAVNAMLLLHAGDGERVFRGLPTLKTEDYTQIPSDVLFLGVVGDADLFVGSADTLEFYEAVAYLPQANREVVLIQSDDYGEPDLLAGHGAPLAGDPDFDSGRNLSGGGFTAGDIDAVDALDFNGYWKLLDGLCDAAFYGEHREYALGGTPQQTDMGEWSDGTPIRPAIRIRPRAVNPP